MALNFPAFTLAALPISLVGLALGAMHLPDDMVLIPTLLLCAIPQWFWIGRHWDAILRRQPLPKNRLDPNFAILFYGLLAIFFACGWLRAYHNTFMPLAGFCWSLYGVAISILRARQNVRSLRIKPESSSADDILPPAHP